jgi:peroxiredoxin
MSRPSFAEMLDEAAERCRTMDAPLEVRLQAFADTVRELDPEFADVADRMIKRLHDTGAGQGAPAPGEVMPEFLLPDQNGRLVSLEQLLRSGPVVVAFHRGHWCPYCRINARALADISGEIEALGAQVVAIAPEVEKYTAELGADAAATYPILTDIDNGYALAINVAIWVGKEKQHAMEAAGRDLSEYNGTDQWTLPIPATFVIDQDGRVKARFTDPDYRKRMAVEDILAAVKSCRQPGGD